MSWTHHGITWKRGTEAIEDFIAIRHQDGWLARYVIGDSFQNLRFASAIGPSIMGPWSEVFRDDRDHHGHERLYRGVFEYGRYLITAAWPNVGSLGLWHFFDLGGVMMKQLVLTPRSPFETVAGNPAVLKIDNWNARVVFEGRGADWHLYEFHWKVGHPAGEVTPLWPGANPSLVRDGDDVYLFYSDPEFNVRVAKAIP